MIRAYPETYLSKAQSVLGEAFDYAVNACNIKGSDFVKMFVASGISRRMENGEPAVISGMSGIEAAQNIYYETTGKRTDSEPHSSFARSAEYWIGWAAAYYQWHSVRSYGEIFRCVSYDDMERMYLTLHEADISKFVDIMDKRLKEYYTETNLKRIRTAYGITQSELAKKADVNLRSIQMYEQRNKDINKASAETVFSLARVLGCTVENLLEK